MGREKSAPTMALIGLQNKEELKHYIEAMFLPGMNWQNYGQKDGWQIDHIRPCASFDMNDPRQQRQCFHYTNLQPLWARDNNKKNSLYVGRRHYYGVDSIAV